MILNKTSTKKRDKMLPFGSANTDADIAGGVTISSGDGYFTSGWIATARDKFKNDGSLGTKAEMAVRTAQTCFMVGLRENVYLRTDDGASWQWRRICFTFKGSGIINNDSQDSSDSGWFRETSNGFVRYIHQVPLGNNLLQVLFKGALNVDWTDQFTAPVDTTRVSLKYDKQTIIRSGNEEGVGRMHKRWHGMYHNLVYDEDEIGDSMTDNNLSVEAKPGMGDYYVIDMFRCQSSGTDHELFFQPESTLYWHEK